nr:hypothetical protein [Candidatus Brachybacter algidus]
MTIFYKISFSVNIITLSINSHKTDVTIKIPGHIVYYWNDNSTFNIHKSKFTNFAHISNPSANISCIVIFNRDNRFIILVDKTNITFFLAAARLF